MRICLVGVFPEYLGEVRGGVANVILYTARGLAARGHDVHVITASSKNATSEDWEGLVVHFVKVPKIIPRICTNITIVRRAIHRKIQTVDPDICHFHGTATYTLGCSYPYLLTIHGIPEFDAKYGGGLFDKVKSVSQTFLERRCRRRVRNVIVINHYIEDVLSADILFNKWMIENPVSPVFFNKCTVKTSNSIVYAGMINRRKNVLGLLDIFRTIHNHNKLATLRLIGPVKDESYYHECLRFVQLHELAGSVEFVGSLCADQIAEELSGSACMILVSFQETAPLIIGEAMAVGVPVVSSNVGGVKYMIDSGVTGFYYDVTDHDLLATAVLDILANPLTLQRMRNKAKIVAKSRFHIDVVLNKTLGVYAEIIGDRS